MENSPKLKNAISYSIIVWMLVIATQLMTGCTKPLPNQNTGPYKELLVWLKPGNNQDSLKAWMGRIAKDYGEVSVKSTCLNCDGSLNLLTGPGIELFVSGHTASGTTTASSGAPLSGEDGPLYYSPNFETKSSDVIDTFDTKTNSSKPLLVVPYSQKPSVKVAVFDTGLEPGELPRELLYSSGSTSCIAGGESGWNFIANNPLYQDDHEPRHGTTVTRFITEQVNFYHNNAVEILPVKTHDLNGSSNLFKILCAFAYAKDRGVKIINASFGFYLPRFENLDPVRYPIDPNIRLLREYVKHYLTRQNILLVAAAGNEDDFNELKAFTDHHVAPPANLRDLEEVSFYPASLARDPDFPNVITATTVHESLVSPKQNYSKSVVDIGVNADVVILPDDYLFKNPRSASAYGLRTVRGSSFATPIVTGKLCANYYLYKELVETRPSINKEAIMEILSGAGLISRNIGLEDKIKNYRVMNRY